VTSNFQNQKRTDGRVTTGSGGSGRNAMHVCVRRYEVLFVCVARRREDVNSPLLFMCEHTISMCSLIIRSLLEHACIMRVFPSGDWIVRWEICTFISNLWPRAYCLGECV